MCWQCEAIDEIDGILSFLLKKDKWQIITDQLADMLLTKLSETEKDAINDAIRYIAAGKGSLTDSEISIVLKNLETRLTSGLEAKLNEEIANFQLRTYEASQAEIAKEAGVKFQFNQTDLRALKWLHEDQMYWIGQYYDDQLRDKLTEGVNSVLTDGLSRDEAGTAMADIFAGQFAKARSYWEGLSDHIVTRSREFGRTEAYVKADVKEYKIVAVIDRRTSKICREMDGRIIPVDKAVELRDRLMSAKNPESVKKIAPWLTDKQVDKKVAGVATDDLPDGLALPPYHWRCRTRTVAVFNTP